MKKCIWLFLTVYLTGIVFYASAYESEKKLCWTTKFERYVKHTVQSGDSIEKLAKIYGTTALKIMVKNNLNKDVKLENGQKLVIPVDGYQEKLII